MHLPQLTGTWLLRLCLLLLLLRCPALSHSYLPPPTSRLTPHPLLHVPSSNHLSPTRAVVHSSSHALPPLSTCASRRPAGPIQAILSSLSLPPPPAHSLTVPGTSSPVTLTVSLTHHHHHQTCFFIARALFLSLRPTLPTTRLTIRTNTYSCSDLRPHPRPPCYGYVLPPSLSFYTRLGILSPPLLLFLRVLLLSSQSPCRPSSLENGWNPLFSFSSLTLLI